MRVRGNDRKQLNFSDVLFPSTLVLQFVPYPDLQAECAKLKEQNVFIQAMTVDANKAGYIIEYKANEKASNSHTH